MLSAEQLHGVHGDNGGTRAWHCPALQGSLGGDVKDSECINHMLVLLIQPLALTSTIVIVINGPK